MANIIEGGSKPTKHENIIRAKQMVQEGDKAARKETVRKVMRALTGRGKGFETPLSKKKRVAAKRHQQRVEILLTAPSRRDDFVAMTPQQTPSPSA